NTIGLFSDSCGGSHLKCIPWTAPPLLRRTQGPIAPVRGITVGIPMLRLSDPQAGASAPSKVCSSRISSSLMKYVPGGTRTTVPQCEQAFLMAAKKTCTHCNERDITHTP